STCPLCSSLSLLTPLYFVDQRKAPKKQAAKLSWGGDDDDESEADSDDDDDDLNEGGMSEKQVSRVLQEEAPQDPAGLFDNDDGVEMASVRSSHSRHGSSSEVSRPPSESCLMVWMKTTRTMTRGRKLPASVAPLVMYCLTLSLQGQVTKREVAFTDERPTTLPQWASVKKVKGANSSAPRIFTVKIENNTENNAKPAKSWPDHACLKPEGQLSVQSDPSHALCHRATKVVEKTLVIQHAWPELHQVKACTLNASHPSSAERQGDLRTTSETSRRGCQVIDHLSNWRSKPRIAASNHIALYQLGVGDICKVRVDALLENDVHVYPGEWGTSEKRKVIWLSKGSKTDIESVFLSPALIDTIKEAFFATPTGFGFRFKGEYVSSHPTLPEPELTIPLVALAIFIRLYYLPWMTCFANLYPAIFEWREGKKASRPSQPSKASMSEKFEGDQFKAVFDRHVAALTALKTTPKTCHTVMSSLFSRVTGENAGSDQGPKSQGNAL
ncbi:hypothetical protein CVT26_012967, partial [Gymnopilus dilepis]